MASVVTGFQFGRRICEVPFGQYLSQSIDAHPFEGREGFHAYPITKGYEITANLLHDILAWAGVELVGLGQQYQDGQFIARSPFQQLQVGVFERMADVHQQNQPLQRLPLLQIFGEGLLPLAFHLFRHLGVAIAGQVDQTLAWLQLEQIDELGAPRGLTGAGQVLLVG